MSKMSWAAHLRAQANSGQTIAGYCRQRGLKVHQFHYWHSKAKSQDRGGGGGFELLTPEGGLCLRRGSWRVDVQAGFDAELLRSVVRALECA